MAQNSKNSYFLLWTQKTPTQPVQTNSPVWIVDGWIFKTEEKEKSVSKRNLYNNNSALVSGSIETWGKLSWEIEAREIVFLLYYALWRMISSDVSSEKDWSVYKHVIENPICDLPNFSAEEKLWGCLTGAWNGQETEVRRAFWCVMDNLTLEIEKWILQWNAEIKAYGQFDVAFVRKNESPERPVWAITAVSRNLNLATININSHWLNRGDIINLTWTTPTSWNKNYKILDIVDANNFVIDVTWLGEYTSWWSVQKLAMMFFWTNQVKWLVAWDEVRLYESTYGWYEPLTIEYADPDNDVVAFESIFWVNFTKENNAKLELVAKNVTYDEPMVIWFGWAKIKWADTISLARTWVAKAITSLKIKLDNNVKNELTTEYQTTKETGWDYTLDISKLFDNLEERDAFRKNKSQAIVVILDTWYRISETDENWETYRVELEFTRVAYESREAPNPKSWMIEENMTWIALHDFTQGYSVRAIVYNDKPWTYYWIQN